ncbi:hypothetical protein Plano_0472 [Planococcus sp. PAMC 21323]|nr:hypothetical protein Plano_0472 [Planococcus sp. PAMC 21323]
MEIKTKTKEKKSRWWIFDVIEFILGCLELIYFLPRMVFRFLKEL